MLLFGIDEDFVDEVKGKVAEGTSTLFLLESGAVADGIHDETRGIDSEIVSTNLPREQEEKLRKAFAA